MSFQKTLQLIIDLHLILSFYYIKEMKRTRRVANNPFLLTQISLEVAKQELFNIKHNDFDQHQSFHCAKICTRIELVRVLVTFHLNIVNADVFDASINCNVDVDDVFFVEQTIGDGDGFPTKKR